MGRGLVNVDPTCARCDQSWWATTRIRNKSVSHVEDERLEARLAWLAHPPREAVTWHGALHKRRLRDLTSEAIRIMRELDRRGVAWTWPHDIHPSYQRIIGGTS